MVSAMKRGAHPSRAMTGGDVAPEAELDREGGLLMLNSEEGCHRGGGKRRGGNLQWEEDAKKEIKLTEGGPWT